MRIQVQCIGKFFLYQYLYGIVIVTEIILREW